MSRNTFPEAQPDSASYVKVWDHETISPNYIFLAISPNLKWTQEGWRHWKTIGSIVFQSL